MKFDPIRDHPTQKYGIHRPSPLRRKDVQFFIYCLAGTSSHNPYGPLHILVLILALILVDVLIHFFRYDGVEIVIVFGDYDDLGVILVGVGFVILVGDTGAVVLFVGFDGVKVFV